MNENSVTEGNNTEHCSGRYKRGISRTKWNS